MTIFYIGGAICAFILAFVQAFAVFVRFGQLKDFNGPTFGDELIRNQIMKSVLIAAFLCLVSSFAALGFVSLWLEAAL